MLLSSAPLMGQENIAEQGVLRATLRNGLKVVIVRNTLAPVVTTMMNYLVGSTEAPSGFPGMAHAQEHMMFRGSAGLSADQLTAIIAAMGGNFNADTQQTVTQYFLTVPSADLDIALRIEAIRMKGVLDSERLWSQERGAIEQEVAQDNSSPEYIFYTKLLAHMFEGTPYAESSLGSVPSFNRTTGAMLKKFHQAWYAPNNAVLVVVGDVEPKEALAEIKERFDPIPSKKIPAKPVVVLKPVKAQTVRLTTDEPHGLAIIAFRLPGYDSPDYPACRVLSDALSSQRGTLFELVPQGKALYAGFSLDIMPQVGLGYAIAAFPKGNDADSLVKEMEKILTESVEKGLPADLVEAAKKARKTEGELKKNSVFGLAQTWSDTLTLVGKESPEDETRAIEKTSVEDVNLAAKKYLDLEHSFIAILTPEASGKAVPGTTSGPKIESFTPSNVKAVKLPLWAEKKLKRLEVPKSTVNPVVTVLPNGLKLVVQPETVSDTVSVYGNVRNNPDVETPKGKKGVDEVLERLFSYGTTSLDRINFQKALDEIGARESAGSDFSLQVLADYFEKGVQLLADNQLNPVMPENDFRIVRQQAAAAAGGRLESPDYLAGKALAGALFPKNDPSLREATPESISGLTLSDVKEYYTKVFRPDLTTIVVMGKITPDGAKSVIEKYFGQWKASGTPPETFLPPVPPNGPSSASVLTGAPCRPR